MPTIIPIDYTQDYLKIQPSLFRESSNLNTLISCIYAVYAEQQNDFLWLADNILNLNIAEAYHLDFIGSLVGQDRLLVGFNTEEYFGFDGAYKSGTFGSLTSPDIGAYWKSRSYFDSATARRLTDEEYRRVIEARVLFNRSDCIINDLVKVINLLTNSNDNSVQLMSHGLLRIKSKDSLGLLSYFIDRVNNIDNILPIPAGVRAELEILPT